MNSKSKILAMVPAMMLGIGLAIPVLGQNTSTSPPVPAGTSMHQAGEETEGAVKNAFAGTVTALDDTTITTEVKAALASGKGIKSNDIHVSTTAGVVTLGGRVQNSHMAARVVEIRRAYEVLLTICGCPLQLLRTEIGD